MQQLIILNGPAGVGKTTVGKLLAKEFENSVCISGDVLKEFIVNRTDKVKGRLGYENGASLIHNFLDAGYEQIIFEYIFPSQEQIEYFIQELSNEEDISVFTLWAQLETIEKRERERSERNPLGKQVSRCYNDMSVYLDEFENVIDTENLTAQDVVEKILRLSKRE